MSRKLDKITFENIPLEFSLEDFKGDFQNENKKTELGVTVDTSAEYTTNAKEYFRRAMIGENSSRSKFRQVLGVKDRVKLGNAVFNSLIKAGACDFDPSNSEISQKEFEVCPLMVSTDVCIQDLESAFMSDEIARGSNNFDDSFAFMNYFYETLSMEHMEEMEYLTYQGDQGATPSAGSEYLATCDGLEIKMTNDADVLKAASPSAVTKTNVIDKLIEGRDALPKAVKNREDYVYIVATNVYEALMDAIAENKASGMFYMEGVVPTFQGKEVYHAQGASDDVIIVTNWRNLLNIQDLVTDEVGYEVVDFFKTRLDRKIGVRTDFKFSPDFLIPEEIFFHKPA